MHITVGAILVEGIMRNISLKLFSIGYLADVF